MVWYGMVWRCVVMFVALAWFGLGLLLQIALHFCLELQLLHLLCGAIPRTDTDSTPNSTRNSTSPVLNISRKFIEGRRPIRILVDCVRTTHMQRNGRQDSGSQPGHGCCCCCYYCWCRALLPVASTAVDGNSDYSHGRRLQFAYV